MEFSHHPDTDDFSAVFSQLHSQGTSDTFDVFRWMEPMRCPGVTVEVYSGATHLPLAACVYGARALARPTSSVLDCGAGSRFREKRVSHSQRSLLPRHLDQESPPLPPVVGHLRQPQTPPLAAAERVNLPKNFHRLSAVSSSTRPTTPSRWLSPSRPATRRSASSTRRRRRSPSHRGQDRSSQSR